MKTEWVHKKLGDCCERLRNGMTYDIEETQGYMVTRIETISDGFIDYSKVGYTSVLPCDDYKLIKGDILFSHINSVKHIGKVAYFDDTELLFHGMNLLLIRANKVIDNKYLFYILSSENVRRKIRTLAKSAVNQASINTTELQNFPISYPADLSAQRRIAAILTSADKVIAATQKTIAKYKQMKQGMMEDLLKPKEGWKKYEYKDVIIENRLGGNYENSTANIGYPVIKMGNIMRGYISLEKVQYLSFEKKYIANDVLKKGDLLFNTRNTLDLVGKVSIWNNELPFALYNSNLLLMKFDENIIGSNEFMNYYFNYHKTLMELRGFAIGTTSVAAIYGRDLDRLSIIVPSIKEQRRIAAILSGIDAKIAAEEKVLEKYEKVKKGLMERMMEGENKCYSITQMTSL